MILINRKIILGITGGIAAYKSAYLARLLVKAGADVQVIMTEAATRFITPLTFESLTGRPVSVEMFPTDRFAGTHHITLAEWPDLVVVAPATADFMAQVANGFCQSLLASVLCATKKKVILAPAMNEGMYQHPATQKNLAALRQFGYVIAEVGIGEMACHSWGPGRMAEPDEIFQVIVRELSAGGPLDGKNILVTAGPCREPLDPVRFISNRSSGKMGFALAEEAEKLGGKVTLITGPVSLTDPARIKTTRVETTDEMAAAVEARFHGTDYLIMAAAPADYKPAKSFSQKIKKGDSGMTVELSPTTDILKKVSTLRNEKQVIVGFSLETENELENAKRKLHEKRLDYIIVNNPLEAGAGFDTDTNRVTIIAGDGHVTPLEKEAKGLVARWIWEYLLGHVKR